MPTAMPIPPITKVAAPIHPFFVNKAIAAKAIDTCKAVVA